YTRPFSGGADRRVVRPDRYSLFPPIGRPFVAEMQEVACAAARVKISPAAFVQDVTPIGAAPVSPKESVDRAFHRLIKKSVVRILGVALRYLLLPHAVRDRRCGNFDVEKAEHLFERAFGRCDDVLVTYEQDRAPLSLLEGPCDMVAPAALGIINPLNGFMDVLKLPKGMAAKQKAHIEPRKCRISAVPDQIDHGIVVRRQ